MNQNLMLDTHLCYMTTVTQYKDKATSSIIILFHSTPNYVEIEDDESALVSISNLTI